MNYTTDINEFKRNVTLVNKLSKKCSESPRTEQFKGL